MQHRCREGIIDAPCRYYRSIVDIWMQPMIKDLEVAYFNRGVVHSLSTQWQVLRENSIAEHYAQVIYSLSHRHIHALLRTYTRSNVHIYICAYHNSCCLEIYSKHVNIKMCGNYKILKKYFSV